jgi:Mechanosensitive ion channel
MMSRIVNSAGSTDSLPTCNKSSLMIAGNKIIPVLRKLAASNADVNELWKLLSHAVHPIDFVVLSLLGWGTVPLCSMIYSCLAKKGDDAFHHSYMFHVSDHISQAAQLAILVYLVDCLTVILTGLGFSFSHLGNLSVGFAKILYIAWAAQRLSVFKRYLLGRAFSKHPGKLGQAGVVDRLVDGIIYIVTGLFLLDILDVEMGIGISSVFAFGSAGTLVMGLASRDVASMFVSGMTLSTSDLIREGDHVKFGDGTTGQIVRIGWMHTTIRGYDELVEVVSWCSPWHCKRL